MTQLNEIPPVPARKEVTYVVDSEAWPEYPQRYVKIGHTSVRIPPRSPEFNGSHNHVTHLIRPRLDALQTGSPYRLQLVCAYVAYHSAQERKPLARGHLERWLHGYFAARRIQGEWFNFPAPINVPREVESALTEYEIATGCPVTFAGGYDPQYEWKLTVEPDGRCVTVRP